MTSASVVSVFDGMACGYLAMLGAGIKIDRYVAFEIDKYAVKTSSHNFPDIEHRGDVFEADFTEFKGFDFLVGGSPCTYWSIAQKNNRETEASGMGWELFSQYVRALREVQPMYFIYENNKSMSNAIRDSITRTFGFEPVCINSALVSAQNRQRLYWVGKRNPDGTYSKVHVEQPEDRGILLRDVLDSGQPFYTTTGEKAFAIPSSYYKTGENPFSTFGNEMRRQRVAEEVLTDREKARCVLSSAGRTTTREYFQKNQGNMAFEPVSPIGDTSDGKAFAIKANYFKSSDANFVNGPGHYPQSGCAIRVGSMPRPNGELSTSQAFRVYSTDGKSVNLVGNGGGAGGKTGLYAVPTINGKTVYEVKDGFITIKENKYPIKLADGYYIIRKLTVSECKRLQTVPEWYEFPVSDSQAYKMLGNGWTVEVISHLINATQNEVVEEKQLNLFEMVGV